MQATKGKDRGGNPGLVIRSKEFAEVIDVFWNSGMEAFHAQSYLNIKFLLDEIGKDNMEIVVNSDNATELTQLFNNYDHMMGRFITRLYAFNQHRNEPHLQDFLIYLIKTYPSEVASWIQINQNRHVADELLNEHLNVSECKNVSAFIARTRNRYVLNQYMEHIYPAMAGAYLSNAAFNDEEVTARYIELQQNGQTDDMVFLQRKAGGVYPIELENHLAKHGTTETIKKYIRSGFGREEICLQSIMNIPVHKRKEYIYTDFENRSLAFMLSIAEKYLLSNGYPEEHVKNLPEEALARYLTDGLII